MSRWILYLGLLTNSTLGFSAESWSERMFLVRHPEILDFAKDNNCKISKKAHAVIVFPSNQFSAQDTGDRFFILTSSGRFIGGTLVQILSDPNCQPLGADGDFGYGLMALDKPMPWGKETFGEEATIAFKGEAPKAQNLGRFLTSKNKIPSAALKKAISNLIPKGENVFAQGASEITFPNSSEKYSIVSLGYRNPETYERDGDKGDSHLTAYFDITKTPKLVAKDANAVRVFAVIAIDKTEFLLAMYEDHVYSGDYSVRKFEHGTLKNSVTKLMYRWED